MLNKDNIGKDGKVMNTIYLPIFFVNRGYEITETNKKREEMPELIIQVNHETGLHARPLTQFVKTVKSFDSVVQVTNLTNGRGPVNGASPINLLLLTVLKGHEIKISAEGQQAGLVLQELKVLIDSNFGEG